MVLPVSTLVIMVLGINTCANGTWYQHSVLMVLPVSTLVLMVLGINTCANGTWYQHSVLMVLPVSTTMKNNMFPAM